MMALTLWSDLTIFLGECLLYYWQRVVIVKGEIIKSLFYGYCYWKISILSLNSSSFILGSSTLSMAIDFTSYDIGWCLWVFLRLQIIINNFLYYIFALFFIKEERSRQWLVSKLLLGFFMGFMERSSLWEKVSYLFVVIYKRFTKSLFEWPCFTSPSTQLMHNNKFKTNLIKLEKVK